MNFSEKIKNARKHGALGALIYNNVEGANINMAIDDEAKKILLYLFLNSMVKP